MRKESRFLAFIHSFIRSLPAADDCPSECDRELWGNGRCDSECNNAECRYDLGDCAGCSAQCPLPWVGDGHCDQACNTAGACNFDGGDCETSSCNQKARPSEKPCRSNYIGDGQCDTVCNVVECDFDKGDCQSVRRAPLLLRAAVLSARPRQECAPGCKAEMVGNGFCDDACRAVGTDGLPLCATAELPDKIDGGDCASCAPGW